jgi:hypothetical protein
MRTRPATPEDYARLKEIHEHSGLKFPMPDLESGLIEGIEVVVDERGEVMMGAAVQRVPEVYLFLPQGKLHPVVKMEGIRLLHGALRDNISSKGYREYFSFVESNAFGRHLKKWFGWEKAWPAYRVRDWKGEPSA